tara:strand:+ start:173 stop:427 length:255 start_codon:yes stop_codon:yes gene_type:complete
MKNKRDLIKQLIYRSCHRGSKEMDILLGSFVNKNINTFNQKELFDLRDLLNCEDEVIKNWYFEGKDEENISSNSITKLLRKHKI